MASGVAFGENMEEGGTERGVRYLRGRLQAETNCAMSSIKTASGKTEKTHSDLGVLVSVSFLQSSRRRHKRESFLYITV